MASRAPWKNKQRRMTEHETAVWRAMMTPGAPIPHAAPESDVEPERRAAPTGHQSNASRGLAIEGQFGGKGVTALLHKAGYTVTRSHNSQSAADVIGFKSRLDAEGPPVRAVQAKRQRVFAPSGLNDAVARYLAKGKHTGRYAFQNAVGTREAWLYCDDLGGWAAFAVLDAEGALTVTGPKATEVEASIRRHLAREPEAPAKSLRERLMT